MISADKGGKKKTWIQHHFSKNKNKKKSITSIFRWGIGHIAQKHKKNLFTVQKRKFFTNKLLFSDFFLK